MVDIVREFLAVHQLVLRVIEHYREGTLRFDEVEELISDSERSRLYRLKERCHSQFREHAGTTREPAHREALFDLAVGSLFHEAMSVRESFYQREVYGPRVRALRSEAGPEAEELFREFERILTAVSDRLEDGLHEAMVLLDQTCGQLRVLMVEQPGNGHLLRYLIEHDERVEEVFGESLDSLLREMEGSAATGYAEAGRSYLESGYYDEAEGAFRASIERGGPAAELDPLRAYARGMAAYLSTDFAGCVAALETWARLAEVSAEPRLARLAHAAVSRIETLLSASGGNEPIPGTGDLLAAISETGA